MILAWVCMLFCCSYRFLACLCCDFVMTLEIGCGSSKFVSNFVQMLHFLLMIIFVICSFWGIFGAYKKCIASRSGRSFHTKFKARIYFFFCVTVSWGKQFSRFFVYAALSPGALFGLVTFSHKIGLYDVQGPIPVVKNVFIPPDGESSLSLELEDVMPLLQFLAPVWSFFNILFPVSYFLGHSNWLSDHMAWNTCWQTKFSFCTSCR